MPKPAATGRWFPCREKGFFDTFTIGETPTVSFFIYKRRKNIYNITTRERGKEKENEKNKSLHQGGK
jgi:hypothetical protein